MEQRQVTVQVKVELQGLDAALERVEALNELLGAIKMLAGDVALITQKIKLNIDVQM